MAKKKRSSFPTWLLAAGAAAVWYFWPSAAQAATVPTTVSAGAQTYMSQIMAAQAAFLSNSQTQAQYTATAQTILGKALADPTVLASDMTTLHAVAGV